MLLFRSEEHVDRWCQMRGLARSAIFRPEQGWELAKAWYADRLVPEFRRKTVDEPEQVFARLGLVGSFWRLARKPCREEVETAWGRTDTPCLLPTTSDMNFPGFGDLRQENGKKQQIIRLYNLQLAQLIKGVWMKAEPAFTRNATFVPPEQVMTRLMRREDERRRYWLDYLILLVSAAGILLGVVLAGRG